MKQALPAPPAISSSRYMHLPHTVAATSRTPFHLLYSPTTVSDNHGRVLFNFANQRCGAEIIPELCSHDLLRPDTHSPSRSSIVLDDSADASTCQTITGSSGHLGFALSDLVNITLFSIDYPADIALEVAHAPRTLIIWGLVDGDELKQAYMRLTDLQEQLHSHLPDFMSAPSSEGNLLVPLAIAEYNPHVVLSRQLFSVFREAHSLPFLFGVVIVQVLNNWGASTTRLCHIGIYGSVSTADVAIP